ncbi:MAG: hypothetical protein UW70_C0001G0021 [Candidatus Peregrinibacteria bacterium GW2011_GWA2_44_7]|nr:MAG: hypothetical protein UW70_C0001G0021 [Candidatus Peregrinibacteria bacterium GW2011_GWA2_44_7]
MLFLLASLAFATGCGSQGAQKGNSYTPFPVEKSPGVEYSQPGSQPPEEGPSVDGPTSSPPTE